MHLNLNKRIADLEKRAPPTKKEEPRFQSMELSWAAFEAKRAAAEAETERRAGLPLEEQLGLEKADLDTIRRRPPSPWGAGYAECIAEAFGVRRVEIAILERDGRIDATMASKLHENAWAHVRFKTPLTALPGALEG